MKVTHELLYGLIDDAATNVVGEGDARFYDGMRYLADELLAVLEGESARRVSTRKRGRKEST